MPTNLPTSPGRTAVIGSGVAGLTAAYLLSRRDAVTLYEREPRLGGHAHTHTVPAGSPMAGPVRVDTGFIVHNDRTYPYLGRLFRELGIRVRDTEMSMSIRDEVSGLEYAGGRGLAGFVARPRQLASPRYLSLLTQVRRFHRLASAFLASAATPGEPLTYGEFLAEARFSPDFIELYAVPVVSCVWSTGRADALGYPARYLFAFLDHHGMLSIGNSPTWRTVVGGSATYVEAVAARVHEVRTGVGAQRIARDALGATVTDTSGQDTRFDRVVVATHPDEALALLADPTPAERDVLGAFRYAANDVVLHRDPSLMPQARLARSSWNYLIGSPGGASDQESGPVVTYWMNRLQGIDEATPLYVTLNATDRIDPASIIAEMTYSHPVYDVAAVAAQRRLPEIRTATTAFAGAYAGWGFHEDGCRSGAEAAEHFGVTW